MVSFALHLDALFVLGSVVLQGAQMPVLEFPDSLLDDPAAYEGYATRFYRDARGNAFQIYQDRRTGRVVHLWADGANASAAFTARDTLARPVAVGWAEGGVAAELDGSRRIMRYRILSPVGALEIGWFLLGSMRQERDFQYWGWHLRPYGGEEFVLAELVEMVDAMERIPLGERAAHLALLDAGDLTEVRSRLTPRRSLAQSDTTWSAVIEQTSVDGKARLTLELRGDRRTSMARFAYGVLSVRAREPGPLVLEVILTTDGPSLTPLTPDRLFNDAFRAFYARRQRIADSLRRTGAQEQIAAFHRLEREVRGLELVSYEEKLMAGLPNFATYFGRDMMMAALMLEPITSGELQERVIASVLAKLAPTGDVSHEEALGGQAIRENAAEYVQHIRMWERNRGADPASAEEHLASARGLLQNLQRVRENFGMIDDDFQLPVLVARYLARTDVPAERKRAFLAAVQENGLRRLDALVRNLSLVSELARPYAERPTATNLVGFPHRDAEGWLPGSWRDSRAGYGNGRFAMDVNVVWVPQALQATRLILAQLRTLDTPVRDTLAPLLRDSARLEAAVRTWRSARRHFEVTLPPEVIRRAVADALQTMPAREAEYWQARLGDGHDTLEPLELLGLALDSLGRVIVAANTDLATDLFLNDYTSEVLNGTADPRQVLRMLDVFARRYPVGLLVEGLGPVVVNDVYADSAVRRRFREDPYHSPRVVWGREVNLLILGLARQLAAAYGGDGKLRREADEIRSYVGALNRILAVTVEAAEASGLRHNELWSYRIDERGLRPVRYGTSSDIQLWNLTDLAVQFALDQLPGR